MFADKLSFAMAYLGIRTSKRWVWGWQIGGRAKVVLFGVGYMCINYHYRPEPKWIHALLLICHWFHTTQNMTLYIIIIIIIQRTNIVRTKLK